MNKHEMEQKLINEQHLLYTGKISEILTQILCEKFSGIKNAFLLRIIPEQAEDIYYLLLNSSTIAIIEISRINSDINNVIIDKISVDEYTKYLSSSLRKTLNIAIKLQNKNN